MVNNDKNGTYLTRRQISIFASFFILLCFVIFTIGYFWGKSTALEVYSKKIKQEEFADQFTHKAVSLFSNEAINSINNKISETEEQKGNIPVKLVEKRDEDILIVQEKKTDKNYYAQLIGFGTLKHAQNFVDRLSLKGYHVLLKKRESRTAKGKIIKWYQVETERYNNKDELMEVVGKIRKLENLKDVRII